MEVFKARWSQQEDAGYTSREVMRYEKLLFSLPYKMIFKLA
jgi:hypothetical protein